MSQKYAVTVSLEDADVTELDQLMRVAADAINESLPLNRNVSVKVTRDALPEDTVGGAHVVAHVIWRKEQA